MPVDSAAAARARRRRAVAGPLAAEAEHLETYGRAGVPDARDDRPRRRDRRRASRCPSLGFAVLPSFTGEGVETNDVDLGPISNFPEGTFVITTFIGRQAPG